ncbi:MAG: helix-turn-helix domain-containing protein [Dehalococcoidia bacterium]
MDDFEMLVAEETERDPHFAQRLQAGTAELDLGFQFACIRQARDISQRMLAAKAGVPQATVARFELAIRTPTVRTLWRLADALDVDFVLGPDYAVEVRDRALGNGRVKSTTANAAEPGFVPVQIDVDTMFEATARQRQVRRSTRAVPQSPEKASSIENADDLGRLTLVAA